MDEPLKRAVEITIIIIIIIDGLLVKAAVRLKIYKYTKGM